MRNLILTLLLLCLFHVQAQDIDSNSQLKINGIGKIHLGMSVKDIPELSKKKEIRTSRDFIKKVYRNKEAIAFELFADTTDANSFDYGSFLKEVRVFQLGEYKINENIKLHQLSLSFFDDKLYEILIDGSEVDELLTLKYGKPEQKFQETPHTYVNGLGIEFIKTERQSTHNYKTNIPGVICYYYHHLDYDYHGDVQIFEWAIIFNKYIKDKVSVESAEVRSRITQRNEQVKKKDIANF